MVTTSTTNTNRHLMIDACAAVVVPVWHRYVEIVVAAESAAAGYVVACYAAAQHVVGWRYGFALPVVGHCGGVDHVADQFAFEKHDGVPLAVGDCAAGDYAAAHAVGFWIVHGGLCCAQCAVVPVAVTHAVEHSEPVLAVGDCAVYSQPVCHLGWIEADLRVGWYVVDAVGLVLNHSVGAVAL